MGWQGLDFAQSSPDRRCPSPALSHANADSATSLIGRDLEGGVAKRGQQ